MKIFLGKTVVCIFAVTVPIALLQAMWADPEMREHVRGFSNFGGSQVLVGLYLITIIVVWCRWVVRGDRDTR
ncbi:MAG: hypothetical protein V4640_06760 [Verrucomicrobiota bacterium]